MTRDQMIAHLQLRGWYPIYSGDFAALRRENTVMRIAFVHKKRYATVQDAGITIRGEEWTEFSDFELEALVERDLESLGAS